MERSQLNRRDFQKLAMAALGGVAAGAALGRSALAAEDKKEENPLLDEPHVCRGLNACKNLGKDKKNACGGQGICATAKAHSCNGKNDCKGQGGCGKTAGENKCKAMGECAVPLDADTWKKTRAKFEAAMKKAKKPVGAAPKAPPKK